MQILHGYNAQRAAHNPKMVIVDDLLPAIDHEIDSTKAKINATEEAIRSVELKVEKFESKIEKVESEMPDVVDRFSSITSMMVAGTPAGTSCSIRNECARPTVSFGEPE
jgi:predicted  nucleic acid-binding Zn-ribbon protein